MKSPVVESAVLERVGDGGSAEKVMDAPLFIRLVPLDEVRACVVRCRCPDGVSGACAMWAMPPLRSTLSRVVGFVLAAMLLNVCGSERYEDDDLDGEGEGGELGGRGRIDASSSASSARMAEYVESRAREDGSDDRSSDREERGEISSPFSDTVLRRTGAIGSSLLGRAVTPGEGRGDDTALDDEREDMRSFLPFVLPISAAACMFSAVLFDLTVPVHFRCSQLMIGLPER